MAGLYCKKGDDDCVKQAWRFEVESSRERGRPRLVWKSMMGNLCRGFGLDFEDAYDMVKYRERVRLWKKVSDLLEKVKMLTNKMILMLNWNTIYSTFHSKQ